MFQPTTDPMLALRPYVPRLLLGWLEDEPNRRVREVDGTVVFVDISGFTKMSERLARKGKVGVEEVTENLGSIFTRMLSVGYAEDGGLLKFGGDSLLLLFEGEDHPTRAARAAFGMRTVLRHIGTIATTAGKVVLRMSVGVHTGTYHLFLVGGSHREFLVAGPAASRVVEMEWMATAGEILLSPETAERLPHAILGAAKPPGILLRSAPGGEHVATSGAEAERACSGLGEALSPPITEHVLAGGAHPEHRRVTVAFIHFDETDELIREHGAETAGAVLEQLVADVQRAANANGVTFLGSDVDHNGGKIILVAGAPRALGDDEERMLLTLRAVIQEERRIPIRVGVNHGPVFVGDVGPPYRRTYTVMGDAVNLAARVMAKAKPGQMLATASVLDASSVGFQTVPLEPFMVKGKKAPVLAFEVGPVAGAKRREDPEELPLVGRGEELITLFAALDEARDGAGRAVELVGNPGIGKTRLLSEIRVGAGDFAHLTGACELYERSTAYAPFRPLLRAALGLGDEDEDDRAVEERLRGRVREVAPQLEPWLPLLAIPLDVLMPSTPEVDRLGDEFRKTKLEEVVSEFLGAFLSRPTMMSLEDVHWMDDASRDLLTTLAHAAVDRPWLILVTRRDETDGFVVPEGPTSISLALQPLEPADAEQLLISASEDAPLRPFELTEIAKRSAGNPLFLREMLAGVRAKCSVDDLPTSVEAMVTAQIDRLPPRDRELLRYASVLGTSFADDVAADLVVSVEGSFDPRAWHRLGEFLIQDGNGTRRFRHALMRDAAYEGLSFKLRRDLHARAGGLILARSGENPNEEAPRLSFHFLQAGRFDEAWRFSRIAADRAWEKAAVVEAAEFYGRALEAARRIGSLPPQEQAAVHRALGEAYWRLGRFDDAAGAFRSVRQLVADRPIDVAEMLMREAAVNERLGRYPQALRSTTRARRLLDGLVDEAAMRQRARLSVEYATTLQTQGRHTQAIRWSERALQEAEGTDDPETVAQANLVIGFAHLNLGRSDADVYYERALRSYEESGDLSGQAQMLNNMGVTAYYAGRWTEAVDLWRRGAAMREQLGDMVGAAYGLVNVGEVKGDQGHLEDAERLFRQALRIWRAAGFEWGVAYVTLNLGRTLCRGGHPDDGIAMLRDAHRRMRSLGASAEAIEAQTRVAEGLVFAGRPDEALEVILRFCEPEIITGEAVQTPLLERVRGYAHLQLEDITGARQAFEKSLAIAREREQPLDVALTEHALIDLFLMTGERVDVVLAEESAQILHDLGLETLPEVPLRAGGLRHRGRPVPTASSGGASAANGTG